MAKGKFDPNRLTVDFKQLMRLNIQDRIGFYRSGGASYFEGLTPTQLAQLFPKQYLQQLPDIGRAVSGGTRGAGGGLPSFGGGGGGGGAPSGGGTATPSAVPTATVAGGAKPTTGISTSPKQSQTASKNSFMEYLEKIQGPSEGKIVTSGSGSPLAKARAKLFEQMNDPKVRAAVFARIDIEVGSQGPRAQLGFFETVANRALARKMSLYDTVSNKDGYYPQKDNSRFRSLSQRADPNLEKKYSEMSNSVAGGSNTVNYATGNGSGGIGVGSKTKSINGEDFGIENQKSDINWAASMRKQMSDFSSEETKAGTSARYTFSTDKPTSVQEMRELLKKHPDSIHYVGANMDSEDYKTTVENYKKLTPDEQSKIKLSGYTYGPRSHDKFPEEQRDLANRMKEMGMSKERYEKGGFVDYTWDKQILRYGKNAPNMIEFDNTNFGRGEDHLFEAYLTRHYQKEQETGLKVDLVAKNLDEHQYAIYDKLVKEGKIREGMFRTAVSESIYSDVNKKTGKPSWVSAAEERGLPVADLRGTQNETYFGTVSMTAEPQRIVGPVKPLPQELRDNPIFDQYYQNATPEIKRLIDNNLGREIAAGKKSIPDIIDHIKRDQEQANRPQQPQGTATPTQNTGAPSGTPSDKVGAAKGVTNLGAVDDWLMSRYTGGGVRWKDEQAAKKYNMNMQDYVVRGIDPKIRMEMYELGQKFEKETGKKFQINTGFRDDYRQSLITSGTFAPVGASQHGGSGSRPTNKEAISQFGKAMSAYGNGGAFDSSPDFTNWLEKNRPADSAIAPTGLRIPKDPFHISDSFSREASRLGYGGTPEQRESLNKRFQSWYNNIGDSNVQKEISDRLAKEGFNVSNQGTLVPPTSVSPPPVPVSQRGITSGMPPQQQVSPAEVKTENMPGLTPAPAPTAVPAQESTPAEPPKNEYGGEYQAQSEDLAVVNARTGQPQFTFNRDEQLSLQDGRLKVTPEQRTNPDNLQPTNQVAPQQQQQPSSYENAAGMFNGISPQPHAPIAPQAHNNFANRLEPASMPQNDGITRAMAQSIGFHEPVSSNYGYGTAANIRNGYNTIIS